MSPRRKITAVKRSSISRALIIALLVFACGLVSASAVVSGAAQQKKTAPAPASNSTAAANVAAGQKIYAAQCDACHFPRSAAKKVGPGLKGIYRKAKFADGKTVTEASMTAWIRDGGKDMPPLGDKLNAEELRQLLAYLRTL